MGLATKDYNDVPVAANCARAPAHRNSKFIDYVIGPERLATQSDAKRSLISNEESRKAQKQSNISNCIPLYVQLPLLNSHFKYIFKKILFQICFGTFACLFMVILDGTGTFKFGEDKNRWHLCAILKGAAMQNICTAIRFPLSFVFSFYSRQFQLPFKLSLN